MNVVVDDHILRAVLLEQEPTWLRRSRRGGYLSTTGSWYYRLCSALNESDILGALSGPIADLPIELRTSVVERVVLLPTSIQMLSLREVGWVAAGLGRRHGLNLLAAEALAAAIVADAAIAMAEANRSPKLVEAANREKVRLLVPGV